MTVEGARQSPPIYPSTKNPDPKLPDSFSVDNTTFIGFTVGCTLAAVFALLFFALLLYTIVSKRRSKANPNSTRVVQTAPDEDANTYEEMETQLHGQAASTGRKETSPSSYQDLIFK